MTVLDLSQKQIDAWNSDKLPIYEPGLEEVLCLPRTCAKPGTKHDAGLNPPKHPPRSLALSLSKARGGACNPCLPSLLILLFYLPWRVPAWLAVLNRWW